MNFQQLLQNKKLVAAVAIGGVLILFIAILIPVLSSGGGSGQKVVKEKVIKQPMELLTTDNMGKAIEIQALLAKQGIVVDKGQNGSKINLTLSEYTESQRDRALLTIVESGLVDQNVGLEIFDKGDFTSTKDDKKIRLARAINGELSRLIRKINPIESASVFVSIPDPTLFTSMQKPVTATVQLVMPIGEKLSKEKIRAITNLLLGSISGLVADNISITDTNGNVYSSIIGPDDEMLDKTEENDEYMKQKVQSQLDKLVGKNSYVVTVSTYLRQVPVERNSVIYDPQRNAVISAQKFSENLGDKNNDKGQLTGAVSLYLPGGLPQAASSSQNRSYNRSAEEMQFGTTKTQVAEYLKEGMIEDISIAVTIENNAMPGSLSIEELKTLIARAASPKVSAQNVEIVFSDSIKPILAGDKPTKTPAPEGSGNPWWTVAVLLFVGLITGLTMISNKIKSSSQKQENELQTLRDKTSNQENQLKEVNQRASLLLAQQEQLQESLNTVRQQPAIPVSQMQSVPGNLQEIMNEVDESIEDTEDIAVELKNWIESAD